ncbi:hypothetical protein [Oligoflexus tunisiensis]|uniref:hypothetical protein n=1 Tax=Oligoflexus tunisiensis TaxID=708132 RepID=UPI00114D119A|nr:hypothetical protein [Oligoflexus tunisiensis]
MKRAIITFTTVILALAAVFLLLPVRKDGKMDATDAFADTISPEKSRTSVLSEKSNDVLHDNIPPPNSPTQESSVLPNSIPEMRAKIREFADRKYFPYNILSAILNGPFTQDMKFMALQAFTQVHYAKSDEVYKNTQGLIEFVDRNLQDMNENHRGVVMGLIDQLNDDMNPNQEAALNYFEGKFQDYRHTDKEMAKLFLRGFKDQDLVKDIMNDRNDKVLSEAAQNLLPQIASPMVIKEILQDKRFTPDQQAVALQRLASNVDGETRPNGMTDADALIILAKDLDQKKGTGDKYYKAVLYGISGSKHKDREKFLVGGMKNSLEPYKAKKGTRAYSSVPELAAMFGYLVDLPERSSAYEFFEVELGRMAAENKCPDTEADSALLDLISFWQDACERSVDDCPEKAKKNEYYKAISERYMALKSRCPAI